jgi:hypothetical protein
MPEYLAPGVFIEEVSFRSKSIEGVSTTTTGFIGPMRYGPIDLEPDIITSLGEFERVYGDRQQLSFGNPDDDSKQTIHNFMWHAVRAFFEEGGKRLYVSRTFRPISEDDDGYAKAFVPALISPDDGSGIKISARFPGELGRMRVRLTLQMGQSVLGKDAGENEFEMIKTLHALTGAKIPASLAVLAEAETLHKDKIEKSDMQAYVLARSKEETI